MISHLPILPVVVPLIAGIFLLRGRNGSTRLNRIVSVAATLALVVVGVGLVHQANQDVITYYALGGWQPPFGIALVVDRLSALMVMVTALLALGCVIFACAGDDEQGSNFHGLFQLQLMGINGAFLTGDLFNLFVFFEVLLLASYALLMHGGGKSRIQAGLHYVVLNLAGSALFLIAVGTLYGATGTLNMADMAQRISQLPSAQTGLVRGAGLMLLVVFGLKAAILPLHCWLPKAYAAAPAPIAALFAIMTKVGIYAILRVYQLLFGDSAGELAALDQPWVWWLGLATLATAAIGVLAARDLRLLVAYLMLVSVGTLLVGLGMRTPAATSALLFYMIHTTFVSGGLFLLAELIGLQRGKAATRLVKGRPLHHPMLMGGLFLIGATAIAGLPPSSGAVAKLLMLEAATPLQQYWVWPVLLGSGLCSLVALSRAGSTLLWRSQSGELSDTRPSGLQWGGVIALLSVSPLLFVLAGPISNYTEATAEQLANPERYIDALLSSSVRGDTP